MSKCIYCGKELGTGDFDGVCQSCRELRVNELRPILKSSSQVNIETKLDRVIKLLEEIRYSIRKKNQK